MLVAAGSCRKTGFSETSSAEVRSVLKWASNILILDFR